MLSLWKRKPTHLDPEPASPALQTTMQITVVGCGDAFGAGGRLQTCFHVKFAGSQVLIDCGASTMIGLHRLDIDPNEIGTIILSHLHGDHYSGLIWLIMHAQHVSDRKTPLVVIGPTGTKQRYLATAELLFPGSTSIVPKFDIDFMEFQDGQRVSGNDYTVTPFAVSHPSGSLSAALRFEAGGKVLSFSGDTEWVENVSRCAAGADLFITECYAYSGPAYYHMTWETIFDRMHLLDAKHILLTHMSEAMLAELDRINCDRVTPAKDGMVINF